MNKFLYISILQLACAGAAFAASFTSSSKDDVVPTGTYDELTGRGVNLGVIFDENGMTSGIQDGVVINYEGAGRLTEINGIRFYNKSSTLTDIGNVYADITMKFTANSSGTLSGLFFRKASQAEGKSIFVDKIDVFTQNGSDSAKAVGINNWYSSTVGDIIGLSEDSFITAITNGGNDSIGIWNQVGAQMGSISNLKITASGGKSNTYAIRNDSDTTIGDISNVVLEAKDSVYAYGINSEYTAIGNLNNVTIEASSTNNAYGIYSAGIGNINGMTVNVESSSSATGLELWGKIGNISDSSVNVVGKGLGKAIMGVWLDGSFGELSNVKIKAQNLFDTDTIGLRLSNSNVLTLKNYTSISAESTAGGAAYAMVNDNTGAFTIKGDSTIHTFDGDIASKGNLIFDGHFKLLNCKIEAMSGMEITAGSSLEWRDKLVVEGDVTIDDSAILNIYLSSIGLDEYLALESDASITLSGEIDLNVYDQGGQLFEDWKYELRHGEGGDQLWITAAVPEPATYAAIFGALALAFAAYRRRR